MNKEKRSHYWMAAVTISFVHEGAAMDTSINALLRSDENLITKKMLENAQVQGQINLAKSLNDQLPDVKHVFIQSISYLGCMSDKEFLGDDQE